MEPNEKRPSKSARMKDAVLVQYTAEMLSPDSPEFQERAKLPPSKRGPNLALYHELAREQPKSETGDTPSAQ
jgi:hypothetical protein